MKKITKKQLNMPDFDTMSKEEVVSFFVQKVDKMEHNLALMQEALDMLSNHRFSKQTEKTKALMNQISLIFDEVEVSAESDPILEEDFTQELLPLKRKVGRKKVSESNPNLEVKEINHPMNDLLEKGYQIMGNKEVEKLCFKPAQLWIERHIYPVYAKEMPDGTSDIQSYYEGHSFLAKSLASPEIVASIMNDKYAKALPLYRIEQSYKNYGAHLSRQTMSNWVLMASRTYLKPIYDKMVFNLLESEVIHADETPVQVLHHQDGSENIQSYMWLYKNRVHPF